MDEHLNISNKESTVDGSADKLADNFHALNLDKRNSLRDKVDYLLSEIKYHEHFIQQLETEVATTKDIAVKQQLQMSKLDQQKASAENEMEKLTQKFEERSKSDDAHKLRELLKLVKELERREVELQAASEEVNAEVDTYKLNLETDYASECKAQCGGFNIDHALETASNGLTSAKMDLAAKLRAILTLKRKIGAVPAHSELIQYELRFSELNAQIQEKHQLTRKLYATYNTLLEIQELMIKETSLLNSINSQFQEAMRSSSGRSKLVESMEAILRGTQQKLDKIEVNLLAEKIHCDSVKEKHAAAVAEQQQFSSLLKAFQEECARNAQLRHLDPSSKLSENL